MNRRNFLSIFTRGSLAIALGGLAGLLSSIGNAVGCDWPTYSECLSSCTTVYESCKAACGGDPACELICRQERDDCYLDCCYKYCGGGPCPESASTDNELGAFQMVAYAR
jgi:hypothetical protein